MLTEAQRRVLAFLAINGNRSLVWLLDRETTRRDMRGTLGWLAAWHLAERVERNKYDAFWGWRITPAGLGALSDDAGQADG